MTQDIRAISPDAGIKYDENFAEDFSPHGTGVFLVHQAAPSEAGVSAKTHAELIYEVKCLLENMAWTQERLMRCKLVFRSYGAISLCRRGSLIT